MRVRFFFLFLVLVSLVHFWLTLDLTREKRGRSFPGYLTFQNGVVGPYYVPGWSGPQKGMTYHAIPTRVEGAGETFSRRDYLFVAVFPAVSGLLFVLLGLGLCLYLPASGGGRLPLLLFHFLVGNYLILSPEFQLTYRFSFVHLTLFAFIPATMIHFALRFPEGSGGRRAAFDLIPYFASGLLLIPYLYFFLRDPRIWIVVEYVVVAYVIGAYLFWIVRLMRTLTRPHLEFNRIIARYLLLGQVVAFVVPLGAAVAIFVGGIPFPLNLATPLTLLFPLSLFIGVILGHLRQSQMRLVQSERMATLGNLLAGLAHELNNPMTFVYSNIEPLRETIRSLKGGDSKAVSTLEGIADNMEEGATRAKEIIENFRSFSYPGRGQVEPVDINRLLDRSLVLLTPKWKDRITVLRRFGEAPKVTGSPGELSQVFVNLLANACEAIEGEGAIEVTTQGMPLAVEIRIRDTGRGIPKKERTRIFDPFYTTKPQGEGTGLGLAIVSQIVKNRGGTIEVKSEVGKGSEFVVTLPL